MGANVAVHKCGSPSYHSGFHCVYMGGHCWHRRVYRTGIFNFFQPPKVLSRIEIFSFADRKVQPSRDFFFLSRGSKVLSRIENFSFADRKVQSASNFFFSRGTKSSFADSYRGKKSWAVVRFFFSARGQKFFRE